MRLLITNDDGIYSPGIRALAEVAAGFGDIRIVAPDVEQSSMGHAVTATRPLNYRETPLDKFTAYRVNGTPADCVALGCHQWGEDVDVVLSGINLGPNLGNAIWHSGTLAAARQASLLGVQGIALSAPVDRTDPNFEHIKPYAREVLELLLEEEGAPSELVNVNFPAREPRGLRWTRQSVRHYHGEVARDEDPMGREHFWFAVTPLEAPREDTDRWAVEEEHLISLTPLRLDLTDETAVKQRKASGSEAPVEQSAVEQSAAP